MSSRALWKEIFALKHHKPAASQDLTTIDELVKCFEFFVDKIPGGESPAHDQEHCSEADVDDPLYDDRHVDILRFCNEEVSELKWVTQILKGDAKTLDTTGSIWCEKWLPTYGCVVMMERTCVARLSLRLVNLTCHSRVHLVGTDEVAHGAFPNDVGVLGCGEIPSHLRDRFVDNLSKTLAKAQRTKRNHPKDAHFVVQEAIEDMLQGNTDGSNDTTCGSSDLKNYASGTCWPLIRAVLFQYLSGKGGGLLFKKAMVNLQLRLTQSKLDDLKLQRSNDAFLSDKDDVFGMLREVGVQLANLADEGYNVTNAAEVCERLVGELNALIESVNEKVSSQFTLNKSEVILQAVQKSSCPRVDLPRKIHADMTQDSVQTRRARALNNLRDVDLFDFNDTSSITSLVSWLSTQQCESNDTTSLLIQMRTIESFFFKKSDALRHRELSSRSVIADVKDLNEVHEAIEKYQSVLNLWRSSSDAQVLMAELQQSRELLVVWIAACLMHEHCVKTFPGLKNYGLPLSWQHLEVIVARENEAVEALGNVTQYVRKFSKQHTIFSIDSPQATFQFAHDYVVQSDAIIERLETERNALERKVLQNWEIVEKKKADADECKKTIEDEKEELAHLTARHVAEEAQNEIIQLQRQREYAKIHGWRRKSHRIDVDRTEEHALARRMSSARNRISKLENRLQKIQRMPNFLVNPVPDDLSESWKVLFSLMMPEELNVCGHMIMKAQQLLVPPKARSDLKGVAFETSWHDHYCEYSDCEELVAHLVFFPMNFKVPSWFGPSTIDEVFGLDDFRRKCVWHPSGFAMGISWRSGANTNPFLVKHREGPHNSIDYFTCQSSKHQCAVKYPDGNDKGNVVYSKLNERPPTFQKSSFLAFGLLRSAPNLQIRKLICALQEDALPWNETIVQTLVRQSVYQVGVLTDENVPRHGWKTDLWMGPEELEEVCASLLALASMLAQTPRRHEEIPLLCELSGFFFQYCPAGKQAIDVFVETTRKRASEMRTKMKNPRLTTDQSAYIRASECLMNAYTLCAYSLGPLDDGACRNVCELVVRFENGLIFSGDTTLWNVLRQFKVVVSEMMTRRIDRLKRYVSRHGDRNRLLTDLLRAVQPRASEDMSWCKLTQGCCYEALSGNVLYYINLFNGVVLVDGHPPGRLPADITGNSRYQELVGAKNFEVSLSDGVFQTAQSFDGCSFDFAIINDQLYLQEYYDDSTTIQLCSLPYIHETLKHILPVRWRELFSHWFWIEGNCVLFRPKFSVFDQRIAVCLVFDLDDDDNTVGFFCEVPLCDQLRGHRVIAQKAKTGEYDHLVVFESSLIDVMSKFESKDFIHTLWTPRETIKIDFPRFEQSFEINGGGEVISCQQRDYRLCAVQQMNDFFPNFTNYLLLELTDGGYPTKQSKRRMIVPVGNVVDSNGQFRINVNGDLSHRAKMVSYDDDSRLGLWTCKTVAARLQLAAIYAAAGSVVPEKRLSMTGTEAALETLRRCWKNAPLTADEATRLQNLIGLSHQEPSLILLSCAMLWRPEQLRFLHDLASVDFVSCAFPQAKTVYAAMCRQSPLNALRTRLRLDEEKRIVGHVHHPQVTIATRTELKPIDVPLDWVEQAELRLKKLFEIQDCSSSSRETTSLPLKPFCISQMGQEMYNELAGSWMKHHAQTLWSIGVDLSSPSFAKKLARMAGEVVNLLAKVKQYLYDSVEQQGVTVQHRVLRATNYVPKMTFSDLICITFDNTILPKIRPDLTVSARRHFRDATTLYLELCVFEDKIGRLQRLVATGTQESGHNIVIDELKSVRRWKSRDHPRWLAFEVEARLQIREEQYVIAKHLIDNPRTICQLNMGRGKTRVILPMLFLYFTDPRHQPKNSKKTVVRAHFLQSLLSETIQYLHQNLSASSLRLQFFQQPFDRTKELDPTRLLLMKEQLDEVCANGGVLITSPSFRLSLELKRLELVKSDECHLAQQCSDLINGFNYVDILDESDELLHHKYHIVYSIGAAQSLPDGKMRWLMAEHVLQVLNNWKDRSSEVGRVLSTLNIVVDGVCAQKKGGFCGVRLTEPVGERLSVAFAKDLLHSSSLELAWIHHLKHHGDGSEMWFVEAVTDASVDLVSYRSKYPWMSKSNWDQLLALRGLLGFGLLEHCLQKRCRERYGIPPTGSRGKGIAVPFVAADLPSERSEFSHPDVAIVLTLLGYYHIGLTKDQMRETLQSLLRLDLSKQVHYYMEWYSSVVTQLSEAKKNCLESVHGIDLTNGTQLELMYKTFRFSTAVINFFLNTCVFPFDVTQYPQQIQRTASHLVPPHFNSMGFSGTNDNHRLLPPSVSQKDPEDDGLLGTNGKMVDCIIKQCVKYAVLDTDSKKPNWQVLLEFSLKEKTHAIVDTGALLAGVTNGDAARFLLDLEGFSFAGVTFYDTAMNAWMVLETRRRQCFLLHGGHNLLEKDTFVIFDEARSRGADMKLMPDAVAAITLGPNTTKHKLMQGCGRMRQLHSKQKLLFVSFPEVQKRICKTIAKKKFTGLQIVDVLQWVLENTKQEAIHGLTECASNVLHFARTYGNNEDTEFLDDDWSLSSLYGGSRTSELIAEHIERKVCEELKSLSSQQHNENNHSVAMVDKIRDRGKRYGYDDEILVSTNDTECERELCLEEEEEMEREKQVASFEVVGEKVWDYAEIATATTALDVNRWISVQSLHEFLRNDVSPMEIASLNWHQAPIYGTVNFFTTVAVATKSSRSDFLRVVNFVLVFADSSMLLLSDHEANEVLSLLWQWNQDHTCWWLGSSQRGPFCFVHLTQLSRVVSSGALPKLMVRSTMDKPTKMFATGKFWQQDTLQFAIICLQVFNGETCFGHDKQKCLVRRLLAPSRSGRDKLVELVCARGNSHKWMLSTVDLICRDFNVAESVQRAST